MDCSETWLSRWVRQVAVPEEHPTMPDMGTLGQQRSRSFRTKIVAGSASMPAHAERCMEGIALFLDNSGLGDAQ